MTSEQLDQISSRWSYDATDVHRLVAALKRPACERAISAIMDCDENERNMIVRLCECLREGKTISS